MQEDLLRFYERELRFIRRMATDFAAKYPAVASRLELEPEKCEDPHVERLIEAFALLSARVRHKIEDEFPEITEALLGVLYPHYLRPVPSMSIVQFLLDREQSKITSGYRIKKGAELRSKPVSGLPVDFRICYPVTLWPIEVAAASVVRSTALAAPRSGNFDKVFAAIRIELKTFAGAKLSEMELKSLRFYLNGKSEITHTLYELIFNNAFEVIVRDPKSKAGAGVTLKGSALQEVGYGKDEGLLPYEDRSFLGYRLLQEFFGFPEKFLFFDLAGIDEVTRTATDRLEMAILLNEFGRRERLPDLERFVNADNFQLGCTPVVNLFTRVAEPIRVTQTDTEYRVVADQYHEAQTEVYSIDRVFTSRPETEEIVEYLPFYSFRHSYDTDQKESAFWTASRRKSFRKDDNGSEVYLSLVDLNFRPNAPADELLTVHVTCTNRDLPGKLPFTGAEGEFEMESAPAARIRCLQRPTATVRPAFRGALQWRLISHLSLNGLSIIDGPDAFRELLKLYDFSDDPVVRRQIAGITGVSSTPHVARVISKEGVILCLGTLVSIEFDEDQFVGTGAFLMANVLEHFIGLYSSLNSFSQLSAKTRQRREILKLWPPRAGEQVLV